MTRQGQRSARTHSGISWDAAMLIVMHTEASARSDPPGLRHHPGDGLYGPSDAGQAADHRWARGERWTRGRLSARGPPRRAGSHPRLQAIQAGVAGVEGRAHRLSGWPVASLSAAKRSSSWRVRARWKANSRSSRPPRRFVTPERQSFAPAPSSRGPLPTRFKGLGIEGLRLLARARAETGLLIVTEAMDPEGADLVAEVADIIQIGARNMQNYSLLKKVGRLQQAGAPQARPVCDHPGAAACLPSTSSPRATPT